jgi:carbon-monoxide dehydrogenase small subunit
MTSVTMTVNRQLVAAEVDPTTLLVQFLRESLRLTGTHVGFFDGLAPRYRWPSFGK